MSFIYKATKSCVCLLLVLALFCGAAACASKDNSHTDTGDTVSFTDDLGREITIKKSPVRVAALIGSFADVWQLSGGSICAAASDAFEDFGISSENCVNLGGAHSPSLELLVSVSPELVLASASTSANTAMREPLEKMGITVAYFDVDSFSDYLRMLDVCTDITCRKDLYEQNGLRLQTEIEIIKDELENKDLPEEKRKILLLRSASSFVKAKSSKGTVLGEMLQDIGCINIADSDETLLEDLSVESIIKNEPYRIFAVTMGNDAEAAKRSLNSLLSSPVWSSLDAVKNGRVHLLEKELFNLKPNSRWAKSYRKLYEILIDKE